MSKLRPGDKVWISKEDDSCVAGWAVFDGNEWTGPDGELGYTVKVLKLLMQPLEDCSCRRCKRGAFDNWAHMAEQLIADGSWD